MFKFLTKNISNPAYAKQLIPITNLLLDMYSHLIGHDFSFDRLVSRLQSHLGEALKNQKAMIQLSGAIEQIFSMASAAPDLGEFRSPTTLLLNGTDGGKTVDEDVPLVNGVHCVAASGSVTTDVVMVNGHKDA